MILKCFLAIWGLWLIIHHRTALIFPNSILSAQYQHLGCQPSRTNLLTNPTQKTYFTEMPVSVFILSKNTSEELNTPVLGYLFAGNSACTKQKTKQNIKAVCNKGPDQRDVAVRVWAVPALQNKTVHESLSDCLSWPAIEHRGLLWPAWDAWAGILMWAAYFYECSNDL